MEAKTDLHYWLKEYESNYEKDVEGRYPFFVDENDTKQEERSPYFKSMSAVLQKRGYLLKKEFVSICTWKTERQKGRYANNVEEDVIEVTKEALAASDQDKIRILDDLEGVGVPVASAILTVVFPDRFCIIDYRAWRALLWMQALKKENTLTFASYKDYSDFLDQNDAYGNARVYYNFRGFLEGIGKKANLTPRQVEMALWKFDQMKGERLTISSATKPMTHVT